MKLFKKEVLLLIFIFSTMIGCSRPTRMSSDIDQVQSMTGSASLFVESVTVSNRSVSIHFANKGLAIAKDIEVYLVIVSDQETQKKVESPESNILEPNDRTFVVFNDVTMPSKDSVDIEFKWNEDKDSQTIYTMNLSSRFTRVQ